MSQYKQTIVLTSFESELSVETASGDYLNKHYVLINGMQIKARCLDF